MRRFESARLGGGALNGEIRMRAWDILRSRAIAASLGAVLVFSVGAFAATQLTHHPAPAGQANTATDTATTGAAATATAGSGSGPGAGANPTATTPPTATISPTATTQSRPTPTIPAGQPAHIQGQVTSVSQSANTFTVLVSTTTYTIVVNAQTTYSGSEQSLSQITRGSDAEVTGIWQTDGSILASNVNAQADN